VDKFKKSALSHKFNVSSITYKIDKRRQVKLAFVLIYFSQGLKVASIFVTKKLLLFFSGTKLDLAIFLKG
jgi:hypothetical protein